MRNFLRVAITLSILVLSAQIRKAEAQECSKTGQQGTTYDKCMKLNSQNASIAWTYHKQNRTLQIAFSGTQLTDSGWVGWGLNPRYPLMVGSGVFVAFKNASGSYVLTYNLTWDVQRGAVPLLPGPVDLQINSKEVEREGNSTRIFVSLNSSTDVLHHVWNRGSYVDGSSPQPHSTSVQDLISTESIDMVAGEIYRKKITHFKIKNSHAITSILSWGMLLPFALLFGELSGWGLLCHVPSFMLCVASFGLGIWLEERSDASVDPDHRNIGYALVVLSTIHIVLASLQHIKKWDQGVMRVGFTLGIRVSIIVLGIVNIWSGFDMFNAGKGWRIVYIVTTVIVSIFSLVALFFFK